MARSTASPVKPTNDDGKSRGNNTAVQAFFDRFAHALTAGNGRAVAALWESPAYVLSDEAVRVVNTPYEVEQFFAGAKEQYNAQGIADTHPELIDVHWVTSRIAIVEVRWPYLDANGEEHGEERSTYTLRRDKGGHLKLRVAIMQGASGSSH